MVDMICMVMTLFQVLKLRRAHNVFFSVFTCVYPFDMLSNFSMVSPLPKMSDADFFPFPFPKESFGHFAGRSKEELKSSSLVLSYLERRLSHPCNQKIAFLHGAATHNKVHYVLLLATYLKLKKKSITLVD